MLVAAKAKQPECKPLLIVLTDGETNAGLSFDKVKPVLAGVKIPIYTIGYNAKLDILRQISTINEAASLNADEGDIAYKIARCSMLRCNGGHLKQFLLWCVVFLGLYGVLSSAYHLHLTRHPRKVLVAVDTSFPMQAVWSQVPDTLATSRRSAHTPHHH